MSGRFGRFLLVGSFVVSVWKKGASITNLVSVSCPFYPAPHNGLPRLRTIVLGYILAKIHLYLMISDNV